MVNMLGLYDFNNMNFVQRVLVEGSVFIDVGANIGAYTLLASENPSVQVISLEPVPAAFAKLEQNIALNARRNVTALNLGASRQPGTLRMTAAGASALNRVVDGRDGDAVGTITVSMDTLDEICRRAGLVPSLIKLDVEGHEPEVLAGAAGCLERCHACLVENGDRAEIVAFMRHHGMAGPFYYRLRATVLQRSPQRLPEDPIYIGRGFARDFPHIAVEGRTADSAA